VSIAVVLYSPDAIYQSWLDGLVGKLDDDFVEAANEQPEQQERPALDEAFR
jgi:antitoxin VapB